MESVAAKRLKDTLAAFSGDPDFTLIGSEVGEEAVGPEALRSFFVGMFARASRPSLLPGDPAARPSMAIRLGSRPKLKLTCRPAAGADPTGSQVS